MRHGGGTETNRKEKKRKEKKRNPHPPSRDPTDLSSRDGGAAQKETGGRGARLDHDEESPTVESKRPAAAPHATPREAVETTPAKVCVACAEWASSSHRARTRTLRLSFNNQTNNPPPVFLSFHKPTTIGRAACDTAARAHERGRRRGGRRRGGRVRPARAAAHLRVLPVQALALLLQDPVLGARVAAALVLDRLRDRSVTPA